MINNIRFKIIAGKINKIPEFYTIFARKLFRTSNIDIVNYCRAEFNFELPGTVIKQRTSQFKDKYRTCDNLYCKLLCVR